MPVDWATKESKDERRESMARAVPALDPRPSTLDKQQGFPHAIQRELAAMAGAGVFVQSRRSFFVAALHERRRLHAAVTDRRYSSS